jgi:hypothetical protein
MFKVPGGWMQAAELTEGNKLKFYDDEEDDGRAGVGIGRKLKGNVWGCSTVAPYDRENLQGRTSASRLWTGLRSSFLEARVANRGFDALQSLSLKLTEETLSASTSYRYSLDTTAC